MFSYIYCCFLNLLYFRIHVIKLQYLIYLNYYLFFLFKNVSSFIDWYLSATFCSDNVLCFYLLFNVVVPSQKAI